MPITEYVHVRDYLTQFPIMVSSEGNCRSIVTVVLTKHAIQEVDLSQGLLIMHANPWRKPDSTRHGFNIKVYWTLLQLRSGHVRPS